MKYNFNKVRRFQEGGPMGPGPEAMGPEAMGPEQGAPEGGAPEQGGGDPLMQIAQMADQALQSQDCEMAMQVCQVFLQLLQQSQGGGGAPEGGAPAEEAPQGEPVYRRGGQLVRRIRY